jgi:hypothetical protein
MVVGCSHCRLPCVIQKKRIYFGHLAGPVGAGFSLYLSGARGHLDLGPKSLVQTGFHLKSPFISNGFRARQKPDWPVYWQPCRDPRPGHCYGGVLLHDRAYRYEE